MKVGIIGKVGAGRSTVFDALTGLGNAAHTPGKMRLGVARVLDPRVDKLVALYNPKSTVYAEVNLALPPNNTAGPVEGNVVREMRDLRAYAHVIGAFGGGDPSAEAAAQLVELSTELVLTDMERVEKRRANIKKGGGDRPGEKAALARAEQQLNDEQPLRLLDWDEEARGLLDELGLMSQRPLLTVVNVGEDHAGDGPSGELTAEAERTGGKLLWLCASLEAEIAELDDEEAKAEFLEAYGLTQTASRRFVQACLDLLDQICFFTVGPDEVRAWPIPRDTVARRAARTIHSDLERGFIRAEVVDTETLLQHGSEAACRNVGKLRMEGKTYIVQDGDVINVRFNV